MDAPRQQVTSAVNISRVGNEPGPGQNGIQNPGTAGSGPELRLQTAANHNLQTGDTVVAIQGLSGRSNGAQNIDMVNGLSRRVDGDEVTFSTAVLP